MILQSSERGLIEGLNRHAAGPDAQLMCINGQWRSNFRSKSSKRSILFCLPCQSCLCIYFYVSSSSFVCPSYDKHLVERWHSKHGSLHSQSHRSFPSGLGEGHSDSRVRESHVISENPHLKVFLAMYTPGSPWKSYREGSVKQQQTCHLFWVLTCLMDLELLSQVWGISGGKKNKHPLYWLFPASSPYDSSRWLLVQSNHDRSTNA